jgi:hypothetical protein
MQEAGMARQAVHEKLESFGRGPSLLSAVLRQFPKKMWLYEPTPDRWSIHETILHLADSEVCSYICCRRHIAERASLSFQYDSARWAISLGYCHQSTREALEVIRRLRKMTHRLLISLPEPVWSHLMEHPLGGEMSLDDWIDRHERHMLHHIAQIRQNYETWLRTHPPRKPASPARRSNIASPTSMPTVRI